MFAAFEFVYQLIVGKHLAEILLLLLFLCVWAIAIFFVSRYFKMLVRPARPGTLTLDGDRFTYEPGYDPDAYIRGLNRYAQRFIDRPALQADNLMSKKVITVTRSEVGTVRLDWVGEHLRLTIDHGAQRYELGTSLTEPEKEWLATRLEEWKTGA